MKSKLILTFLIIILSYLINAQTTNNLNRWTLKSDRSIVWNIDNKLPHNDHIEMSGRKISVILRYGVNADQSFSLRRTIVWPMLRTIPNNTHASLIRIFDWNILSYLYINGRLNKNEKVEEITLNGIMTVKSLLENDVELTRTLFPSTDLPAYCEKYSIKNNSKNVVWIEIPELNSVLTTNSDKGVDGSYFLETILTAKGVINIQPGDKFEFGAYVYGHKKDEDKKLVDLTLEEKKRADLIELWNSNLILQTPDSVINALFAFSKIRASESIFETKGGLMHGPGGEAYYAAIWANDQAEYVGPFFPFLGYDIGNQASLNAYMHFSRFINPEYKPIPSSIVAEGTDIWNGAGDRGDQAMIAYGAARFALSIGNKETATKLWPLIEWCLEYLKRKTNQNGVVNSESDELEGRFPSGDANLCTSSLYYDALLSAVMLGKELGKPKPMLADYTKRAENLKNSIEKFFGRTVEGFETYRYYDGNDVLRSWICIPLTMGIYDRKQGTIDALFSPRLWTDDGLATQAGDKTFWDRSTLYALRGVLAAGETERAIKFLKYYSNRRLLGEHVPYPVEAYPEGGQRHLSAESGLYCRIFTEGLFGIRPTGFKSFDLTPQLPKDWNQMSLKNVKLFDYSTDIDVIRIGSKINLKITTNGKIIIEKTLKQDEIVHVKL